MLFGPFVYDEKIVLAGPLVRKDVDILKAETRTDAFLARNPNRQVPLLEWHTTVP